MPKPFTTPRTGKRGTSYRVTYWDEGGAQRLRTFKSKNLAADYERWRGLEPGAADQAFDLKYGAGVAPTPARPKAPTVAEFWEVVRAGDAHSRNRSQAADSVFRNQLEPFHARRLDAVTELEVKAWIAESLRAVRTNKAGETVLRWKPRTVADALAELRRIYRAAVSAGHVKPDADPAARVRMPKRNRKRTPINDQDVYTVAELDAVLKCVPRRWRGLFTMLGDTGARLSEIVGLRVGDLDLDGGRVTLGGQIAEEVTGPIVLRGYAKSDASTGRETWVMPDTVDVLRDHLVDYPNRADSMFRTESGAIPSRANLRRIWVKAVATAGVRYLPMRNLRHMAASHMIAANLDIAEVAQRLGHANPNITLQIYTRFVIRRDDDSAARMTAWRDREK